MRNLPEPQNAFARAFFGQFDFLWRSFKNRSHDLAQKTQGRQTVTFSGPLDLSFNGVCSQESFEFAHADDDVAEGPASRDFPTFNFPTEAHYTHSQHLRRLL